MYAFAIRRVKSLRVKIGIDVCASGVLHILPMAKIPQKKPPGVIDTRLKITDPALCSYIDKYRRIGVRQVNEQILYMLRYAAAQMSAHDQESMKEV